MNVIYKFPILDPTVTLLMPKDAKVLAVHEQNGEPCMWVYLDGEAQKAERKFLYVGTAWPIQFGTEYLGTAYCGRYVWHLFEDFR